MDNNYSLTDLATVTNGGGMGWGGGSWLIILLAIFLLGGGAWGNRAGDYGQFATAASQQEILFGQRFSNLDNKMDRLGNGICDATYALNNSITNEGRGIQNQASAIALDSQRNIDALRYDMAQQTASTNAAVTAQTQKILDAIAQDKIASLQAQVSELKTQNLFCGIPRISNEAYGIYPYSTGCGCRGCGGGI